MLAQGLKPLFEPRSIGLIGASDNPTRIRDLPLRVCLHDGFDGRRYPFDPSRDMVQGQPAFADIPNAGLSFVPLHHRANRKGSRKRVPRYQRTVCHQGGVARYPAKVRCQGSSAKYHSGHRNRRAGLANPVRCDAGSEIGRSARCPDRPMISGAAEPIVGARIDTGFGPVASVGLAGCLPACRATLRSDPPFENDEALNLIRSLSAFALLNGARGNRVPKSTQPPMRWSHLVASSPATRTRWPRPKSIHSFCEKWEKVRSLAMR